MIEIISLDNCPRPRQRRVRLRRQVIPGISTDVRLAIEYHLHLSSREPKALRNANLDESDILNEMAECGALASLPQIDWNQILGASSCASSG